MNYKEYIDYLHTYQDIEYKNFHEKIANTNYPIIGIRVPTMRKIAKDLKNDYKKYLEYNEKYYEEVFIKGLLISNIKDTNTLLNELDKFTYKIDSWAICDSMCSSLKIVNKNKEVFYDEIIKYINSDHEFRIRVGIILLFDYYINDEYIDNIFEILKTINSDYYYVKMAIAWLLCETFIKYRDKTIKYIENNNMDKFILRKTVSKINDSYRVEKEDKMFLKKYL